MSNRDEQEKQGGERHHRRVPKGLILITLLVIAIGGGLMSIMWAMFSWKNVETGHALLIVDAQTGQITGPFVGPTAGFLLDGWKHMIGVQYPVDIYYATEVYEDTIECFSSDQLAMRITIQMRWQLNTSRLVDLYRSYPRLDFESSAIDSIMEKNVRIVTKNFNALETIEFRDTVAQQMQQQVFDAIAAEPSLQGALSYLTFDMKNIGYPTAYTQAIEDKLVKEQMKLGAEFERERILILANATAQETILMAEGEAQAKIIIANSTKQAIEMILTATGADPTNATRIAELYLWVETLKEIAPNIDKFFLFTGQDGVPLLFQIPQ